MLCSFGSARALDREQFEAKWAKQQAILAAEPPSSPEAAAAAAALEKLRPLEWMIEYIDKTRELARRLTEWSIRTRLSSNATLNGVSRNKSRTSLDQLDNDKTFCYPPHSTEASSADCIKGGLYVCTGGAGGFMEAANRGASDVPGGRSVGMGISLPFETGLNPYVTPSLAFECAAIPYYWLSSTTPSTSLPLRSCRSG